MCADDARKLAGLVDRTIVINTTYQLLTDADHLYACDDAWWLRYYSDVAACFTGQLWCYGQEAAKLQGVRRITGHTNKQGLCQTPWEVNTGRNSGHQAIGLAYHLGAAEIVLMGYDMQGGHWHGRHPDGLNNTQSLFGQFIADMRPLARDLKAAGVRVINASRQTALDCFERVPLEQL